MGKIERLYSPQFGNQFVAHDLVFKKPQSAMHDAMADTDNARLLNVLAEPIDQVFSRLSMIAHAFQHLLDTFAVGSNNLQDRLGLPNAVQESRPT